jgi:flagellar biosynthetic protein FliP
LLPPFAQLPVWSQPLAGGGQSWSLPVQTLVFITSLTFIPAILLMMTSFTRIIIVFGLLRNALGTPSAPPNQVLLGLALFLTFFIMSPVIDKIYTDAYQPFSEDKISMQEALDKGAQPLREFMLRQTREADLALFARLANTGEFREEAVPCAFCCQLASTSELKTAFQIGFTIFIPFLIIDLVIASVLMALGMMMVPPAPLPCPLRSCSLCWSMAGSCWSVRWHRVSTVRSENDTRIGHDDGHGGDESCDCRCRSAALVALVTGLIISILQAATQINEMTLSFIPENHRGICGDYRCRAVDAESAAGLYAQPVYQPAVYHRLSPMLHVTSDPVGSVARRISGRCCASWR